MSSESVKKPMAAIAPFGLRMQPDLKERVEKAAAKNNRSMNAEIIAALEEKFPPEDDLEELKRLLRSASPEVRQEFLDLIRGKQPTPKS